MGFVNEDGLLLNGAVLFQDDYNGGKTLIQCSVFSGINRGSQRIVTINRFSGNILDIGIASGYNPIITYEK